MSSNNLAAWAILAAAFIFSTLPTASAGGSTEEWFYDWDYDTEDD